MPLLNLEYYQFAPIDLGLGHVARGSIFDYT
ncbi:hypothetical protein PSOS111911_13415 [Pseudoalteromonas ostreae]